MDTEAVVAGPDGDRRGNVRENHSPYPPGTVRLVEKANELAAEEKGPKIIKLVPAPAATVNDPLNWPRTERYVHMGILTLWMFMANASTLWSVPVWAKWTVELKTSFTELTYGQAFLLVMIGIGVFFGQSWAAKYGRRLVYIVGSVLVFASLLFGRFMTDIRFFYAYQIVGGFGSAPAYATVITSVLDLTFLHERGRALSTVLFILGAGNILPPVAGGFIADSQGWRWCFNYLLIFFGVLSLMVLLLIEETLFARDYHKAIVGVAPEAATGATSSSFVGQEQRKEEQQQQHGQEQQQKQKDYAEEKQGLKDNNSNNNNINNNSNNNNNNNNNNININKIPRPDLRLPYLQRVTLFRRNQDIKAAYWQLALNSFRVIVFPAAAWMALVFVYSIFVVSFVVTTLSSFFHAPPYNYSASIVGLLTLPLFGGTIVGAIWAGPGSDAMLRRSVTKTRRQTGDAADEGGLYQPEQRLWMFLPVPYAGAAGCLLYGIGASRGMHVAVPCIGLALIGFYLNTSLPVASAYALDTLPKLEGQAVQMSIVMRTIISGAVTFGLRPWITNSGPQTVTIVVAVLLFFINSFSIVLQIWGRTIREKTAHKYYQVCEATHAVHA